MSRKPFDPSLIRPPAGDAKTSVRLPVTVSQITAMVKGAIDATLPKTVHVVGEISNFKRHGSGHLYLTLKDAYSELSCVMWKSQAAKLVFAPSDGLQVIATGRVDVFDRAGRYQLYVRKLEPRGTGALELAFRQLKEKLEHEGLFDDVHKRPLPAFPRRIALVSSSTGAAIADMLRTIQRRFPCVEILVYPVAVQGGAAKDEIASAVRALNRHDATLGKIDLMIVGRGGGSIEDLWAFNEEVVARALFASEIPVISAVGHEVDVTIADLVADVRAATPTAAAEIAVPVLDDVLAHVTTQAARLDRAIGVRREILDARLQGIVGRRAFVEPLATVRRREQVIDELTHRMQRVVAWRLANTRRALDAIEPVLQRIAPHVFLIRAALRVRDARHRLDNAATSRKVAADRRLDGVAGKLERTEPQRQLAAWRVMLDGFQRDLTADTAHRVSLATERARRMKERLDAMSHVSVLRRGFSITRTKKRREVVRSLDQLHDRQRIVTEVASGEFESEVVNLNQLELFGD